MKNAQSVFLGMLGMVLVGAIGWQAQSRRVLEHRYAEVVTGRRQLELQYGEVLATHDKLKEDLGREQQRSRELSDALADARRQLEDTVGRLTEEMRTVAELQQRMAAAQGQMDQLQGELAMTLAGGPTPSQKASGPVQLERVVVSDGGSSGVLGRVMSVHADWHFVVVNLGWDAVKIGDTVSIFRDDRLIAKARVERVQQDICAATLLEDGAQGDVKVNDFVRVL